MSEREPAQLTHRTAQQVVQELLQQQELISELLPEERPRTFLADLPGSSPAVKRYTGARSTQPEHEERNLMVGALLLLGATDRQIEAACHVTRRSIPVILADLEKTGRVTPLKDRLALLIGDNAERAAIALRELLDQAVDEPASIELAGMIKAVATAVGITVEKHALLTGGATERIETMVGAGRGEIEAWAREFAIPVESVSRPVDTPSAANPSLSAQTNTLPPMRHTADTSASLTSPNAPTPAADPTRSEATGADPGGGLSSPPGSLEKPTNQ